MKKNQSKEMIDLKIEDELFQTLIAFVLSKVKGVALPELGLMNTLFARSGQEKVRFIEVGRNDEEKKVDITITVKIDFGLEIPKKAKEIQKIVREEVEKATGYQVDSVYVIFKAIQKKLVRSSKEMLKLDHYTDQ